MTNPLISITNGSSKISLMAAILAAAFFGPQQAWSGNTWDGGGDNGNWSTDANWTGDAKPGAGGALFFGGTQQLDTYNDYFTSTSGITFLADAGSFVLGGNQLSLGGDITNQSANTQTLALNLILQNTRAVYGVSDVSLTGTLTNSGGNRQLTNNLTSGVLRIGAINLSENATSRALTLASNGTTIVEGVIANGGGSTASSFSKAGWGELLLTKGNTYGGATSITGGTLTLDFSASGAPASDILYNGVTAGAASISQTTDNVNSSISLVLKGADGAANSQTLSQLSIANSGARRGTAANLVLAGGEGGSMTLTLSGASNPLSINAGGTLDITKGADDKMVITNGLNTNGVLSGGSVGGANTLVTLNKSDWAFLDASKEVVAATYSTSFTTTSATNLDVLTTGTLSGSSLNTLRFNQAATTLALPGSYTIRGVLVTAGVGASDTVIEDGTLQVTGQFAIFQNNTQGDLLIKSALAGSGSLLKSGSGTAILNGASLGYTGSTYVNEGSLLIDGALVSGTTYVARNARFGGNGSVSGAVYVTSGGIVRAGAADLASGGLTSSSDLNLGDGSIIEITLGGGGTHSSLTRTGGTWSFDLDQAFSFLLAEGADAGFYDNIISGLSGSETGLASIESWTILNSSFVGAFSYDGSGGIDLVVTNIPEPSAVVLIAGGALASLAWKARARRGVHQGKLRV